MIAPVNRDWLDQMTAEDLRLVRRMAADWIREVDDALAQLEADHAP